MIKYIVWLKQPSGHVQTHKIEETTLDRAITTALRDGFENLGNHPGTRAIFACEEGVA